ncbi:MAG: hypothetical protein JW850_11475, partial [Thermoflexales bacterium]|nr:hypothetical protein [Thermoflexales bacterium]
MKTRKLFTPTLSSALLLAALLLALLLASAGSSPAQARQPLEPAADWCGAITANTTWAAADNPHIVTCDVTVNSGVTLTIEPGAVVKFSSWTYDLWVNGTLIADGTELAPITFTSINDNSVGGSTGTGSPAGGDWSSLRFNAASFGSILDYAVVRYG